jgi:hypothetical protein
VRSALAALAVVSLVLGACGDADDDADPPATTLGPTTTAEAPAPTTSSPTPTTSEIDPDQRFPDVVDAELTRGDGGAYRVSVTLSSPYDTPERYADAWRVLGADGTVYGVRELLHDHQFEQPFTRSLDGVEIPAEVTEVVIEGRDQLNGWGGGTLTVPVPAG